jgi:hypothetical protein
MNRDAAHSSHPLVRVLLALAAKTGGPFKNATPAGPANATGAPPARWTVHAEMKRTQLPTRVACLIAWPSCHHAAAYTRQYRQPLLYNRVGVVDRPKLTEESAEDIELVRQWKGGTIGNAPPRKDGGSKFRP